MTTLLVKNPNSRNGDSLSDDIMEALAPLGDIEIHTVGESGSLESHIESIGDALKRIVVAGGDGSLNRALPAVLEAGVPLGVLPMGTANDFARSLNLPNDPVAAANLIAEGNLRVVDVGVVNDKYFLNAVGVGLGPELTKKMDREKKKRLGVLAYLESLVQIVGRRSRRYARITVDGQKMGSSFMQISIANGRHYGGGMMVSDEVEMDDGLLHLLCVRPLTPSQLFMRGLRFRFGAVGDDEKLVYMKGKHINVETRRCSDVTADGELITRTPISCRTLHRSLTVYACKEEAEMVESSPADAAATGQTGSCRGQDLQRKSA